MYSLIFSLLAFDSPKLVPNVFVNVVAEAFTIDLNESAAADKFWFAVFISNAVNASEVASINLLS